MRSVEVLDPGPNALIQDLGRPGHAHLGVPPSGALDQPALRLANRLVGNPEGAAGVEALLGGLRLLARVSCTIAVTGPAVSVRIDGREVGSHVALHLRPAQTLALGTPASGLRCYVAISGGVDTPVELGSRSRDVLSGIGPPPLAAGDLLALGAATGVPTGADTLAPRPPSTDLAVPVLLGPREDWFIDPATGLAGSWTITSASNRVGLRLDGSPLRRVPERTDTELPSEGIRTGAIQVPPSGLPVVFLADHPTTGGYPVVAVVHPDALPSLAQARPGTILRFRASF
ncbi:biotin-dependent carboxyltransferase family protein [Amycolatopsis palatopharyngis]|uniref:5-oxoprolinase subunit C family protein n=1 Tax=Amycolatopsis palatopharyngis TaxID=187982 RepID=UPI000E23B68B|nr:biotin-dependent carboxyltransferase family protein [Amycolatopsis palatopharyngis]